jgi:hypothetical protein
MKKPGINADFSEVNAILKNYNIAINEASGGDKIIADEKGITSGKPLDVKQNRIHTGPNQRSEAEAEYKYQKGLSEGQITDTKKLARDWIRGIFSKLG